MALIKQADLDRLWSYLQEFQLTPIELSLFLDCDPATKGKPELGDQFASNAQCGKAPVTTEQVFEHFVANNCTYSPVYCSVVARFIQYAATTSDSARAWCQYLIQSNYDAQCYTVPSAQRELRLVDDMKTLGIKIWSGAPKAPSVNPELKDDQR